MWMKPSKILAWMSIGHVLAQLVSMILVCVFLMRETTSVARFEGPFHVSKQDRVAFNVSRSRKGSSVRTDLLLGCHECPMCFIEN